MIVVWDMLNTKARWISFALTLCCSTFLLSQPSKRKSDSGTDCKCGLHATLNVKDGYYRDPRFEHITFRLMNDCDQILDSATKSWTLVIDEQEASDPGGQLWMGPKPTPGYDLVKPGATVEFGKALPFSEYFPEARDYKLFWKAAGFKSNVVIVRGGATPLNKRGPLRN